MSEQSDRYGSIPRWRRLLRLGPAPWQVCAVDGHALVAIPEYWGVYCARCRRDFTGEDV